MSSSFVSGRRGVSIAAAALSLALVAPFAPAVAAPSALPAAVAQNAPTGDANGIIDADAIASGRVTTPANLTDAHGVGKGLISGHVYMTHSYGNPGAAYDNGLDKLDGITVYAQFRDKDGSYSPIFSAKTHHLEGAIVGGNGGHGTYAFGTGDKGISWTDARGKEHVYSARTDQQHRVWVDPFTNDRGNRVEMIRQANGFIPGSFNGPVRYPLGSFVVSDGNMHLTAAFLQEVAPAAEDSWMAAQGERLVEDPKGPISNPSGQLGESNVLSGRVWLETGGTDGDNVATGPNFNLADQSAEGYTVYASTLTRDGAAANKALHEKYSADAEKLTEETKRMLTDHPEYILKTVYGKTDKQGSYSLRFGEYTDKNQSREDFLNPDHVFVWVENENGVVQHGYTGFQRPIFQRYNHGGGFRPQAIPAENQTVTSRVQDLGKARYGKSVNSLYNVNYAIMPYAPARIAANFNATDKLAAPGATVTPEFSGVLSSLPSKVEWRDAAGKVVKTCDIDQSQATKAQVASCTFDIPKDAKEGNYFNVVLVSGGNDVSAWTVMVQASVADTFDPAYAPKVGKPGEVVTSDEPTFADKDGKKADTPAGVSFALGEDAPAGASVEAATGVVSLPIPADAISGDVIEVPVVVTYRDGSTDEVAARVTVDTSAAIFSPAYMDGAGKPGETVKLPAPLFTDSTGRLGTPEGVSFAIVEKLDGVTVDDKTAKVSLDKATGEITVVLGEDAKPGSVITVPVEVTYADGSKETISAKVTVLDLDAPNDYHPMYVAEPVVPAGGNATSAVSFTDPKPEAGVASFAIQGDFTAPKGWSVKIDKATGTVTATAAKAGPEGAREERLDVPVDVTYNDRAEADVAHARFLLDTDGDGIPDIIDEDDDNDGFTDVEEEKAGTDPKDAGEFPWTMIAPIAGVNYIPNQTVVEHQPITPVTVTPQDPKGTISAEQLPAGLSFDEKTKQITGTPEIKDWGKTEEVRDLEVTVRVTNPDGSGTASTFTITVQRDTDGDGIPDIIDEDDDNDGFTDVEEIEAGTDPKDASDRPASNEIAGDNATAITPTWDNATVAPGERTEIPNTGDNIPAGSTVVAHADDGRFTVRTSPNGTLTVVAPKDAATGEKTTITVKVTYPDGSVDVEKVTVTVVDPADTTGDAAATTTPNWDNSEVAPGATLEVPNTGDAIDDADAKVAVTPRPGSKGKDAWTAEIDKDGTVSVTPGADAKDGDKVEVTIEVTYPDGSQDTETFTVTVVDNSAPTVDAIYEGAQTISGAGDRPGEKITITLPNGAKVPAVTDSDGTWKIDVPADVTLDKGDTVTATDEAGNVTTVTVKEKPKGDVIPQKDPEPTSSLTEEQQGRCIAAGVGLGLPLLALVPLALASQVALPGLEAVSAKVSDTMQDFNTMIQQQANMFSPAMAEQAKSLDNELRKYGADLGTAAGAIAGITAAVIAGIILVDLCVPREDGTTGSSAKLINKIEGGKQSSGTDQKQDPKQDTGTETTSSPADQPSEENGADGADEEGNAAAQEGPSTPSEGGDSADESME